MKLSWHLLLLPVLGLAFGCDFDDDFDDRHWYHDDWDGSCGNRVERGSIDVDAPLTTEPGIGVGVFVEYQAGGRWNVFTTCDTDDSGYDCSFDILVDTLGRSDVVAVAPDDLERNDSIQVGRDSVRLVASTAFDTDGFSFDTEPGEGISIDVLLDGRCGNAYVYWVGDGAIHEGAPSNPFELEPVAP